MTREEKFQESINILMDWTALKEELSECYRFIGKKTINEQEIYPCERLRVVYLELAVNGHTSHDLGRIAWLELCIVLHQIIKEEGKQYGYRNG